MQITIVGAGAIGGSIGAHLARAGLPVTLCDASVEHVAAINRRGLAIQGWAENFSVKVPAILPDGLRDPLEVVLLAVKAQHTATAMDTIAPLLADDGVVVSLQN